MHLLKETAKPVPMGKKRRKIKALRAPGEPIVIPPNPRPSIAGLALEAQRQQEESKEPYRSKRNKTATNAFNQ